MISRVGNVPLETPSLLTTRCSQSLKLKDKERGRRGEAFNDTMYKFLRFFCVTNKFFYCHFLSLPVFYSTPHIPVIFLPRYFSYSEPLYFSLSSLLLLLPSSFHMPLHNHLLLFPFNALPPPLSSFLFLSPTHTNTPGDWAGPEVWSQALVGDRQAPEGAYRQAVPWALAQPPEPRGEEDIVDWGGGPHHLPGTREAGQPMGRNR